MIAAPAQTNASVKSSFMPAQTQLLQRKCACGGSPGVADECEECAQQKLSLQRSTLNSEYGPRNSVGVPSIVHEVLSSSGQPLDARTRAFMEPRFGHDFSQVRVHTDERAADSAGAVNALAYTVGNHIVFGSGSFVSGSTATQRLLAHELTHVVQQSGHHAASGIARLTVNSPDDPAEQEAEAATRLVVDENHAPSLSVGSSLVLQRQCLTGAVCNPPIHGAPGQFIAQTEAANEPARAARAEQVTRAREAAQAPASQPAERAQAAQQAAQQIQAAGHGARAVNLERLARDVGLVVPNPQLVGIFVDADMPADYGGYGSACTNFSFVQPPTTDPNMSCIFFPREKEAEAQLFYSNPAAETIGPFSRALWRVTMVQLLTHEFQHVRYGASPHGGPSGRGCSLTTEIHRSGTTVWTISLYLTELSAIISEFLPLYRAIQASPATPNPVRNYLQHWLTYKIDTAHEAIGGTLKALRCRCSCAEVNEFVRDTFNFTTSSWQHSERVYFNSLLSAWPNLNWPLTGDPVCIDRCESDFQRCLPHSSFGMGGMDCLARRSSCFGFCAQP